MFFALRQIWLTDWSISGRWRSTRAQRDSHRRRLLLLVLAARIARISSWVNVHHASFLMSSPYTPISPRRFVISADSFSSVSTSKEWNVKVNRRLSLVVVVDKVSSLRLFAQFPQAMRFGFAGQLFSDGEKNLQCGLVNCHGNSSGRFFLNWLVACRRRKISSRRSAQAENIPAIILTR